jgi:hypothetical protein
MVQLKGQTRGMKQNIIRILCTKIFSWFFEPLIALKLCKMFKEFFSTNCQSDMDIIKREFDADSEFAS